MPAGPDRESALKREDTIAALLGETFWPRHPRPTKSERRFATAYFNRALDVFPRGVRGIDDPDFCGPVVERNGTLVPRNEPVKGDAVDRIDKTTSTDFFVPE
jgi:hypothetical protein